MRWFWQKKEKENTKDRLRELIEACGNGIFFGMTPDGNINLYPLALEEDWHDVPQKLGYDLGKLTCIITTEKFLELMKKSIPAMVAKGINGETVANSFKAIVTNIEKNKNLPSISPTSVFKP